MLTLPEVRVFSPERPTSFASPERSPLHEIDAVSRELASEGLLCRLLDAMPEFVMILNEHRQLVFGNLAVAKFAAQHGVGQFNGMRPGDLLACHVAAKAASGCGTGEECRTCGAANAVLEAQAGRKADKECRILTSQDSGGCALDLGIHTTPLEFQGKQYVLLVANDISDAKRRQVLERIFFHDILNSAGSVKGIADLLSDGSITLTEIAEDLKSASAELVSEIQGQRTLVSAENGDLTVNSSGPYLSLEVLESIVRSYRNHTVCARRHIRVDAESEGFEFWTDLSLLGRVLGNLAKNALEASSAGETVTLGCAKTSDETQFWCHNPKVMPRDVQLQMFQRSFSTKGAGRGIGTYSIRLLTNRYLKGHVTFVSSQETGTVFRLHFPHTQATTV